MKAKEKLLTIITGSVLLTLILLPVKTNAALQANGSGSSTKNIDGWMSSIRQMESQGGTLGLTGSSSLTQALEDGKVKDSNNLDIHMQKNTEYGAMAILSASNYGKPTPVHVTTDGSLSTTTGNKSGVYMSLNKEWVAAGTLSGSTTYKNANLKYRNPYTENGKERKKGDATFECSGWHKTGNNVSSTWLNGNRTAGFIRANSGSIFSFYCESNIRDNGDSNSGAFANCNVHTYASRAVVVIGNGF